MSKRSRPSTWLISATDARSSYTLAVDSDVHLRANGGVPVDFVVKIADLPQMGEALDLSGYAEWEVGVEQLSAPNNVETFQSIDVANRSVGFFRMSFNLKNGGVYWFPVCHLPHKRYSARTVLAEVELQMRKQWLITHNTWRGVNVVGDLFISTMFTPVVSMEGFVDLLPTRCDHKPFASMFRTMCKDLPGLVVDDISHCRVSFSTDLKEFLGPMRSDPTWNPGQCYPNKPTEFYGVVMDEIVFERSVDDEKAPGLMGTVAAGENVQSLVHLITDMVPPSGIGKTMGSIATCRIPVAEGESVQLQPGSVRWVDLKKKSQLASFRLSIVDSKWRLVSYKGGNIATVLRIRAKQ